MYKFLNKRLDVNPTRARQILRKIVIQNFV